LFVGRHFNFWDQLSMKRDWSLLIYLPIGYSFLQSATVKQITFI
jgi:hypothetical protein